MSELRDFSDWRRRARRYLAADRKPDSICWDGLPDAQASLFAADTDEPDPTPGGRAFRVSAAFVEVAQFAALYRADDRWDALYRVLWRLTHGEPQLMAIDVDDDVRRLKDRAKAVARDRHKMKAFVRFKALNHQDQTLYVAWFEPKHLILPVIGAFFRDRFANMHWQILTPDGSLRWDGQQLTHDTRPCKDPALSDSLDEVWKTYYRSTFNPARLKIKAMQAEMPQFYWKNLPEAELIGELIANAGNRVNAMLEQSLEDQRRRNAPRRPRPR